MGTRCFLAAVYRCHCWCVTLCQGNPLWLNHRWGNVQCGLCTHRRLLRRPNRHCCMSGRGWERMGSGPTRRGARAFVTRVNASGPLSRQGGCRNETAFCDANQSSLSQPQTLAPRRGRFIYTSNLLSTCLKTVSSSRLLCVFRLYVRYHSHSIVRRHSMVCAKVKRDTPAPVLS